MFQEQHKPDLCEEFRKVLSTARTRIEQNIESRFQEKIDFDKLQRDEEAETGETEEGDTVEEEEAPDDGNLFSNVK